VTMTFILRPNPVAAGKFLRRRSLDGNSVIAPDQ